MKKIVKKIFNSIGLDIKRLNPELKNNLSFDEIYQLKIKDNCTIFDIGANKGQSIERFRKIFPNSIIHSFEPNKAEFEIINKKYQNDKKIIINNIAIGDKIEKKNFFITALSGTSSFNKLNLNTQWIKKRSSQYNTSIEGYTKKVVEVDVLTLDQYCKNNSIDNIDIVKIDTQGYEDKILGGSSEILEKNIVKMIELEVMFDDVYERHLSFSDIEKYLLPYNFRFSAITTANNNLFEGLVFFADVIYINTKKIKI